MYELKELIVVVFYEGPVAIIVDRGFIRQTGEVYPLVVELRVFKVYDFQKVTSLLLSLSIQKIHFLRVIMRKYNYEVFVGLSDFRKESQVFLLEDLRSLKDISPHFFEDREELVCLGWLQEIFLG